MGVTDFVPYTMEARAMNVPLNNPKAIAEAGERIYRDKFQVELEASSHGKYAAINVEKETVFVSDTPEGAFDLARKDDPQGIFHLVRVGYAGAFQLSYQYGHGAQDWLFG
jgi:hypothetical protein